MSAFSKFMKLLVLAGGVRATMNPVTGRSIFSAGGAVPSINHRSTPVRIAYFGDSTANLGVCTSPDSQYIAVVTAPFPASGATSIGLGNLEKSAVQMYYPQAHPVANCGVSGEATAQMLIRDGAAVSATRKAISDAFDQNPDVIIFRCGSINNIASATSGNWQTLANTAIAEHQKLLWRALSSGLPVIDTGIYGYGDGSGAVGANPASVRLALKYINDALRANAANLVGQVWYLDPVGVVQDVDGKYISGVSHDGVHLNFTGQYLMAKGESLILSAIFGDSTQQRYRGANLIANAMMQATGSQSYGTVATGFSCGAENCTRANAAIEYRDGRPYQVCEFTITGAGAQASMFMPCPVTTVGIVANDVYGFEYDFFVEGLGGFAPTQTSLYGRVDLFKSGAGRVINACFAAQHGVWPSGGVKGHSPFPPLKIQEASEALTTSSSFNFVFACSDAAGKFKVGVSNPRMVKLNQAVLTS